MFSSIAPTINLFALEIVTLAMVAIVWRLIGALDNALERQQGLSFPPTPQPVPAKPPQPLGVDKPGAAVSVSPESAIVTPGLIAFVKTEEGFRAHAYGDYKQWSIGYGTRANSPNDVITEAEATQRLLTELDAAAKFVEGFIPSAPLGVKQGMTDATYNLGPAWHTAGLGACLANGQYDEAKQHLMEYVHAGGTVLQALVDRRTKECNMFDHPV